MTSYYQMASDRLNPRALSNKAILLLKNNVTMNKKVYSIFHIEDFKETIRLLKLSIHLDPNNKDANYHLGNIYENGLGIPQNVYTALKFYKKGMKLGHLKSQTKFAVALYNGYPGVIQKDEKTALELLEDSANKEEPDALNYLGLLLEKGSKSVRQDKEKSVQFFKKSHEKGNDLASLNLALNLKSTPMISAESSNNYKEFIHISAKRGNEFAKMLDEHILANEKAFKNTKVGKK